MMNRSPAFATRSPIPGTASAGHPFRASLPARVLRALPRYEPEVLAAMRRAEQALAAAEVRSAPVDLRRLTMQDVRDFLIAYCACFLAVMVFIA